jgi:hypothetical protein
MLQRQSAIIRYCLHQISISSGKELRDGDRIRFELEVQNSVSVPQFLTNSFQKNRLLREEGWVNAAAFDILSVPTYIKDEFFHQGGAPVSTGTKKHETHTEAHEPRKNVENN